jgi:hypothetical protein
MTVIINAEPIPQIRSPHFGAGLEHFQEKCVRFSARKMRKDKDLNPIR